MFHIMKTDEQYTTICLYALNGLVVTFQVNQLLKTLCNTCHIHPFTHIHTVVARVPSKVPPAD